MKKQQSLLQNEIERLEKAVKRHEENGQFDTYDHTKLARLQASLKPSQGAKKQSEVDNNGSSN